MGKVSFAQSSFLGGEVSQSYQGRFDRPDYRTFMNVCLNSIPIETGAVQRRPGTRLSAPTRGGAAARVITFDFRQNFPYTMETTDGFLRFHSGVGLVTTNDAQDIVSISAANPAVVTTGSAHGWATGNSVLFPVLDGATQLLARVLRITVLSPTTFSLVDEITSGTIDGAALDAFVSGTVARVLEVATPYTGGSWSSLRSVQAEEQAILLNGTAPQVLSVLQEPSPATTATFALSAINFLDGPYLDPIPGSWVTSSATSGVVTLTFSFQPYVSTIAYSIGDYVSDGGVGYKSLTDSNVGHTPASSPTHWLPANGGDPINSGAGFTTADIGRLVRLFSEPSLWVVGLTYADGQVVAYDDGSGDGVNQYWKNASGSLIGAGVVPGTSASWSPLVPGAIWTWGRILTVSGAGVVTAAAAVGELTLGGGVAAAIDGNTSKNMASSANNSQQTTAYPVWVPAAWAVDAIVNYNGAAYRRIVVNFNATPPPFSGDWLFVANLFNLNISSWVGGHFSAPTAISYVTVFPTADLGFTNGQTVGLNLRGSVAAPTSSSDGAFLGTAGTTGNTFSPVTIVSSDTATLFNYIWIEIGTNHYQPLPDPGNHLYTGYAGIAQIVFYAPSVNNGSVVTAQIVGPAMLYSGAMRKWRLGVYGGANGWPTNGTYHEGRLWLSGVVGNRVDASKSNDLFNFAPSAPNGVVSGDNGISATFNAPDVSTILWMTPDQQGIVAGTQAGEWLVSAAAPGAMAPSNIKAARVTKNGCANIEPRRTDHTLVFVQKFRRSVVEYFADVYSGKFSAPDLADRYKHLTARGIAEIAYQQEKAPIIWHRMDDGSFIGATYRRDTLTTAQGPTFVAAHPHQLGSGRSVESICVGPSAGGTLDALSMVTTDGAIRHVEVMTDLLDEGFALSSLWLLDDAIAAANIAVLDSDALPPYGGLKINGLWPHNGKTVSVFVAGLDCGAIIDELGQPDVADFVVADGSVTVPYGDSISGGPGKGLFTQAFLTGISPSLTGIPIVVGFTYDSDGQLVRPATGPESGAQAGPALAKERRIHREGTLLYGAISGTISFGVTFDDLRPAALTQKDGMTEYTPLQLWSGVARVQVDANSDFDNMPCWRQSRPNAAAFMIALGGTVQTQDG